MRRGNIEIPRELQYLYYAVAELVDVKTANNLLDSGKLAEWVNSNQESKDKEELI